VQAPRQARAAVLDSEVGDSCAAGDELADDLRVYARREDDVGFLTPEPVSRREALQVCARSHPEKVHSQALSLESLEVWSPVTQCDDKGIETERSELGEQQSKLPLAAPDAESRTQD
jgi:hypothetical protein